MYKISQKKENSNEVFGQLSGACVAPESWSKIHNKDALLLTKPTNKHAQIAAKFTSCNNYLSLRYRSDKSGIGLFVRLTKRQ